LGFKNDTFEIWDKKEEEEEENLGYVKMIRVGGQ